MNLDGRLEPAFHETSVAGPLQGNVNSPDFSDWQKIDWSTLATPTTDLPGGNMSPPIDGNNGLFESGNGFVSTRRVALGIEIFSAC